MITVNRALVVCAGALLPVALLVPVSGCSSSSNGASPPNVPPEASTDGASDGVSLTWATTAFTEPASYYTDGGADDGGVLGAIADGGVVGVADVQVCVYLLSAVDAGTAPTPGTALSCVNTAADGTFVFPSVPVRTNVFITLTKAGFTPVVLSVATASSPMDGRQTPVYMFPTSDQVDPVPGVTVDWQNKGQLYTFALGPSGGGFGNEPGVVLSMAPMSGSGPLYQDSSGHYQATATATVGNTASYFNVDPGVYTLTFTDSMVNCQPIESPAGLWGYPLTTPAHSLQALVLPGYISGVVGVLCTDMPPIVSVDGG